jgi:Effector-associated domain 2/TIR domain
MVGNVVPDKLTPHQISELVELLLDCPSMSSSTNRLVIIRSLPKEIANNITSDISSRAEILNMVRTCLYFPGGLETLLENVRVFDKNTVAVDKLEKFFTSLPRGSKAIILAQPSVPTTISLRVFIEASADVDSVQMLYDNLKQLGFEPWTALNDIVAGQNYFGARIKALRASHVILFCFTKNAVLSEAMQLMIKTAKSLPEHNTFIIPVLLEEGSQIPIELEDYRVAKVYDEEGYQQLVRVLQYRAKSLNLEYV